MKRTLNNIMINSLASSKFISNNFRVKIYKLFGLNIKTKNISPGCFFGGTNIYISEGTFINYDCFFDNTGRIKIGKDCHIGMQVMFCTSTHHLGNKEQRAGMVYGKSIIVGDGCWIGARVTILPGVEIGNGCIIGAGSLVTKDCESNGLYVGIPVRKVKELM